MEDIKQEFSSAIPDARDRAILRDAWGGESIQKAFEGANLLESDPRKAFDLTLKMKLEELQPARQHQAVQPTGRKFEEPSTLTPEEFGKGNTFCLFRGFARDYIALKIGGGIAS